MNETGGLDGGVCAEIDDTLRIYFDRNEHLIAPISPFLPGTFDPFKFPGQHCLNVYIITTITITIIIITITILRCTPFPSNFKWPIEFLCILPPTTPHTHTHHKKHKLPIQYQHIPNLRGGGGPESIGEAVGYTYLTKYTIQLLYTPRLPPFDARCKDPLRARLDPHERLPESGLGAIVFALCENRICQRPLLHQPPKTLPFNGLKNHIYPSPFEIETSISRPKNSG